MSVVKEAVLGGAGSDIGWCRKWCWVVQDVVLGGSGSSVGRCRKWCWIIFIYDNTYVTGTAI